MFKIAVVLLAVSAWVSLTLAGVTTPSELPRPSYARTMLKVSRSLPGETEEVKVKTSEGSVATLIVKRREKSIPSKKPNVTQEAEPSSTTIGYKKVDYDPWNNTPFMTWTDKANEPKAWEPASADNWKPVKPSSWLESSRSFENEAADDKDRIIRYAFLPHESVKRTNIGANVNKNTRDAKKVPAEVVIRSEVNVKSQPGAEAKISLRESEPVRKPITVDERGIPVVTGVRVPDDPIDKIQVWRNARVINDQLVMDPAVNPKPSNGQSFDRFFEDINRRYSKSPEDDKVQSYRNDVLAAEIYETSEEAFRPSIRKRMLQPEVAAIYPNSRLYSSPSDSPQKISLVKSNNRAPVLSYVHPDLGPQPAVKVVKKEETKYQPPTPMSTYPPYGEHRHKKKYVMSDKNVIDASYGKSSQYPKHVYYKRPVIEPPFWVKISEGIKSHFTDGVSRVSELTKPVFDPLVEATRKISENLGLSRSSQESHAQDKIGTVASGSSVLIPALGLVASGAALGIGAVAVGRYLDVDVLKRSMSENANLTDEERERALGIIAQLEQEKAQSTEGNLYLMVQDEAAKSGDNQNRRMSSVDEDDDSSRRGVDKFSDIVEVDVPTRPMPDGEEIDHEAIAKTIVKQAIDAFGGRRKSKQGESKQLRRRRSLTRYSQDSEELSDALQNLENAEVSEASGSQHADWTNTPCAKRLFCDTMIKRGTDAHILMEKKMAGLLRMIQPSAVVQVSAHFDEVMEAVRRHDCSRFSCPQARPASVSF